MELQGQEQGIMLSLDFIFRLLGAIVFAIGGGILGNDLSSSFGIAPEASIAILTLVGFLIGLIMTPYITLHPLQRVSHRLSSMPPERLIAIIAGIFIGLMAAALVSLPLGFLPPPFRQIMPLAAAVIFCYLSIVVLISRQKDLQGLFGNFRGGGLARTVRRGSR